MMSVTEYAKDVSVSVSHILKLCDKLNIPVNSEDDMLSEDDIIMLDEELDSEDLIEEENLVDEPKSESSALERLLDSIF